MGQSEGTLTGLSLRDLEENCERKLSMGRAGIWYASAEIRRGVYAGHKVHALGKGATAGRRKRSALGECLERRAVFERGYDIVGSYSQLGAAAIDPRELGLDFPGEEPSGCMPFDVAASVAWTQFSSLVDDRKILIHRPVRGCPGALFRHTTSGAASGETPEAAYESGLLELVERDALSLAWRCGGLGPAYVISPTWCEAAAWLAEKGMDCKIHDITTDLGIAVILAIARNRSSSGGILAGCAAGRTYEDATTRALLEIVQALEGHLLSLQSGDDLTALDENMAAWLAGGYGDVGARLMGNRVGPRRRPERTPLSLAGLINQLMSSGIETFAVNEQVAPGWFVAETVAPGLVPLAKPEGSRGMRLNCSRLTANLARAELTDFNRLPMIL